MQNEKYLTQSHFGCLPVEITDTFLRHLIYPLTPANHAGLHTFRRLCQEDNCGLETKSFLQSLMPGNAACPNGGFGMQLKFFDGYDDIKSRLHEIDTALRDSKGHELIEKFDLASWTAINCQDCFLFLLEQGVIKATWYDRYGQSFLWHSLARTGSWRREEMRHAERALVERIPAEELVHPLTVGLPGENDGPKYLYFCKRAPEIFVEVWGKLERAGRWYTSCHPKYPHKRVKRWKKMDLSQQLSLCDPFATEELARCLYNRGLDISRIGEREHRQNILAATNTLPWCDWPDWKLSTLHLI
jgi:hypothetical protein